jgi:hypothetical protein
MLVSKYVCHEGILWQNVKSEQKAVLRSVGRRATVCKDEQRNILYLRLADINQDTAVDLYGPCNSVWYCVRLIIDFATSSWFGRD